MNILINPYTGTNSIIDRVYEHFQTYNLNKSISENECANGVCKLPVVKILPLDLIEKEIVKTFESISAMEIKPTVYIFALNQKDLDMMTTASKNWNSLTQNGILKIILLEN
jgi:hypothetical protein